MRRSQGFTLVEVLLATIIGTLVVMVAFAMFRSVTRSRQMLEYYARVMAHGRYALTLIRNDLANFSRSVDPDMMRLRGIEGQVQSRPADRLLMYVVSRRKVRPDKSEGDVYEVEYGISHNRVKGISFLGRRCGAVENGSLGNPGGVLRRVAMYISELKFEYYYEQQWQRYWQRSDEMPQLVRVSITLADPDGLRPNLSLSQEMALEPLPSQSLGEDGTSKYNVKK